MMPGRKTNFIRNCGFMIHNERFSKLANGKEKNVKRNACKVWLDIIALTQSMITEITPSENANYERSQRID